MQRFFNTPLFLPFPGLIGLIGLIHVAIFRKHVSRCQYINPSPNLLLESRTIDTCFITLQWFLEVHCFMVLPMDFEWFLWCFHGISIKIRPSPPVVIPGPATVGAAQRLRGPGLAQPRHAAAAGGTPGGAAGGAARAPRASHLTGIMFFYRGIIPKWPYFRFVNYYNLPR